MNDFAYYCPKDIAFVRYHIEDVLVTLIVCYTYKKKKKIHFDPLIIA